MTGTLTLVAAAGSRRRVELRSIVDHDRARDETYRWIKSLRSVRYGDRSMRARFTFRGESLWWFTEIYLHKMRRLETAVATLLALESVTSADAPARVLVESDDPVVRKAAQAFSAEHRTPLEIVGEARAVSTRTHGWNSYLIGLSATLSRLRPRMASHVRERAAVAAFVHTAFWNVSAAASGVGQERYIGSILDAVASELPAGGLVCVGVGPRRNFRTRRWWDPLSAPGTGRPFVTPIEHLAPRAALKDALALWNRRDALSAEIVAGPDIRAAGIVRGCDLWDVLQPELEQVARLQWPWSARAMDEAGAAIDRLSPEVVVTYAEAGGWGRALMLEARRRRVRSVGLQHGFIYRHWLNYRHEPDEMAADGTDLGFPRPDRTLVFDRYAARTLESTGNFPPESIAITGSPALDRLVARVAGETNESRVAQRRDLAVDADGTLLIVAAKFTEIAGALPEFLTAAAEHRGLRVVIKPHPAESPALYAPLTTGLFNVTISSTNADLGRLLHAADGLVTMNSTIAIDALALGVPSLVIGLPTNLSPFVEAGVMFGSRAGSVGPSLDALLYDRDARAAVMARAAAFATAYGITSDGQAARRAADAIVADTRT